VELQNSIQRQPGLGGHEENKPGTNHQVGGSLEIHEKEVIMVPCPECGVDNMVQMRLEAEVTQLSGEPNGASMTATPDVVLSCGIDCHGCTKEFYVFLKPLGARRYAVEASLSARFREPKEVAEAVDLRFDFEREAWQKLAGEEVVGVIRASGRTKN
jgi:hypothetical protein